LLCDRDARGLAAVKNCDADLDFCDLPVEIPRHIRLAQEFHLMHLRLGTAPVVISCASSQQGARQIA
jgi:hypothetical protein